MFEAGQKTGDRDSNRGLRHGSELCRGRRCVLPTVMGRLRNGSAPLPFFSLFAVPSRTFALLLCRLAFTVVLLSVRLVCVLSPPGDIFVGKACHPRGLVRTVTSPSDQLKNCFTI